MGNTELLVKLFDLNNVYIGKGKLSSITPSTIIIKGKNLPVLSSNTHVYVHIYDERTGISPYSCFVSVAVRTQVTAQIIKKDPIIERRTALKVRTDLSFYISKIYRNDEDITDEVPTIKINVLNLSIGGMLISSNFNFRLNDEITFNFNYYKNQPIHLRAKIIRKDEVPDEENEDIISLSYGCLFLNTTSKEESIIFQYLFDRQIQLHKNRW